MAVGAMAAFLLLSWFSRLPSGKSPEEALEEMIDRGQFGTVQLTEEAVPFGRGVVPRLQNDPSA